MAELTHFFNVIDDTPAQTNWPSDVIAATSQQNDDDANGCRIRTNQMPGIRMEYVPFNSLNEVGPGEFTDNCPITSFSWEMTGASSYSGTVTDPALGGFFPNPNYWYNKGVTTVTYTREDCSGAIQTHTFTVTVLDDEPAEITCQDSLIELTTSTDGAGD